MRLLISLFCGVALSPFNTVASAQDANADSRQSRVAQPTHQDVSYGSHPRNVLDFYAAKSDKPAPLLVYIHGGGFVKGDKGSLNRNLLRQALDRGINVAAVNYRFVDGEDVLFPIPQHDGARAVQFLRSKAPQWNIDKQRVACFGGSAGAGISMWIGFHDDLADPASEDPVERESTRLTAIGSFGGQGTYNPIEIKELVGGRAWQHPSIFKVYGVETPQQALHPSPEMQDLYDEASAITHLTKDDPPLFMIYNEPDVVPPADAPPGKYIHHPNFGKQLQRKMNKLGIKNIYLHTADLNGNPLMRMLRFFEREFGMHE